MLCHTPWLLTSNTGERSPHPTGLNFCIINISLSLLPLSSFPFVLFQIGVSTTFLYICLSFSGSAQHSCLLCLKELLWTLNWFPMAFGNANASPVVITAWWSYSTFGMNLISRNSCRLFLQTGVLSACLKLNLTMVCALAHSGPVFLHIKLCPL